MTAKPLKSTDLLQQYIGRLKRKEITFLANFGDDRRKLQRLAAKLLKLLGQKTKDPNRAKKQLDLARDMWPLLMRNALREISTTQTVRGLGRLRDYYNKSVQFEDFLFGLDPTYRDHSMHAFWVYLLGDFILSGSSCIPGDKINWAVTSVEKHTPVKEELDKELNRYADAVWCIISLCHDLAYPFEKAEEANKKLEEICEYLGIHSFERLRYTFSTEQGLLVNELIRLIATKVFITEDGAHCIADEPTIVDMSQSLENRLHGILSAYLLYRLVDTMGEIPVPEPVHAIPENADLKKGDARDLIDTIKHLMLRRTILHAIASHTCPYAYSRKYNTFRFILSLVDEIEEFSRYMRLGRSEIEEICEVTFEEGEQGHFKVEYRFKRKHLADPRDFFAKRAERFIRMVEVDKKPDAKAGIRSLRMTCIDAKRDRYKRYSLKIDRFGVQCRLPGKPYRFRSLGPDPESELRERLSLHTKKK